MEQNLKSVVFLVLNQVETHVELSKQSEIFHISELSNFCYFVQTQVQKSQTINVFKTSELKNLIFTEIESPEIWQLC